MNKINWVKGDVVGLIVGLLIIILPRFITDVTVLDLLVAYSNYVSGLILYPLSPIIGLIGSASFGFLSLLYSVLPLLVFVVPGALLGYFLQKKNYIAVGIVIVIFIIPFVLSTQNYYKTVYPQKMYDKAIKTNDQKYCYKISDQTKQGECLNQIGQTKQDLGICGTITDPQLHDACVYNTLLKMVKYGVCKEVSTEECQKDMLLCNQVNDSVNQKDCKRYMSGKLTAFQQHDIVTGDGGCKSPNHTNDHDQCILDTIKNSYEPDLTLCNLIVSASLKTQCKNIPTQ